MIDLRSDTVTKPTEAMLDAMHSATYGDDSRDGDATVQKLEALAAQKTGKEAGVFVPDGAGSSGAAFGEHGARRWQDNRAYWSSGKIRSSKAKSATAGKWRSTATSRVT